MPSQEPMLTRRPSSHNDERATEEDALLTGQRPSRQPSASRWARYREIALFAWGLIATAAVIVLAVVYQHQTSKTTPEKHGDRPTGKRNLVFMVSDGMGPTSLALTRGFNQHVNALPWDHTLGLDKLLIGNSRTRSSNSLVTDSAAGATAFSCGHKSYNGAISVTPDHSPCGSVMEAAKRAGYTTGLVVTTRITDATPACFVSHVRTRMMEDEIAEQLIGNGPLGRNVDLVLGGGRCHFLPNTTAGGCRADGRDLIQKADEHDWNYVSSREDFDNLGTSVKLPLLGLFAPTDIPFEIDRRHVDSEYPSLEEMTKTALRALKDATKDSDQGFFVMIEGSRIDHAGHNNDPAAQVHEVLAYDRAMQAVIEFLEEDDTEGLMVATSDHETGGLATARQLNVNYPEYLWYPGVLANATHSAEHTARLYFSHLSTSKSSDADLGKYLTKLIDDNLGIKNITPEEIDHLIAHPVLSPWTMSEIISKRSQTGWSTHGHSAVDVNIYSSNRHASKKLHGNHENTEVGEFLRWYLDVEDEVKEVTKELKEKLDISSGESWLGAIPSQEELAKVESHLMSPQRGFD
ncbi:alkaline phosphatase-like protein [Aureobasidium namibiae CBS 147.97]|uniref:Alkaline phosphatase n=1 Tax=Aureobasidium namibiae CBS 147.97 TaxID=1043004 RepID=A0A074W9P9_9PEZI|nr:alkaline phosphatase-like protein [Aureobasidium namibiae CBS 147.97]KEQ69830.1 alkaline phosphatase-like protein [Aureobasidium namibiae CBS 147.97]